MKKGYTESLGINVRSPEMRKVIPLLLFLTISATAYAAGDVEVTSSNEPEKYVASCKVVSPVVTEQYEYYEIRGDNEKELRNQLSRNGCMFNDGKKYDALTTWRMKLDYGYRCTGQACTADSVKVSVTINMRYPKWVRSNDVPRQLVDKWDNYITNLVTHENKHRDIAVDAATELSKAVAALPPAPSCSALDLEVRALSRRLMEKLNTDEKRLDETTSHGKTDGAVL
jgi:predicted secreted Zn-dependent protease